MAEKQLLKSIRIIEPVQIKFRGYTIEENAKAFRNTGNSVRLDVYQKGKRKFAVLSRFGLEGTNKDEGLPTKYFPEEDSAHFFEKVDRSMSDDAVLEETLSRLKYLVEDFRGFSNKQMILQDPWQDDPPKQRYYGFDYYYLNDGTYFAIEWFKGTTSEGSKFDDADSFIDKQVKIFPYTGEGSAGTPFADKADATKNPIMKYQNKDGNFDYGDKVGERKVYSGIMRDENIVNDVLFQLKLQISRFNGTQMSESQLALCDPDSKFCKLIKHVDFNAETPPTTTEESAAADAQASSTGGTASETGNAVPLVLVGLPEVIQLKAKRDLESFKVWVGEPPKEVNDNTQVGNGIDGLPGTEDDDELDQEYQEEPIDISAQEAGEIQSWSPQRAEEDKKSLEEIQKGGKDNVIPDETVVRGNWDFTTVPGEFVTNSGIKIQVVAIDGKPVNLSIASAYLDMYTAAKKDGVTLSIGSGFRSPYDSIEATVSSGWKDGKKVSNVKVSASSQKYLYDGYKAGKPGFNVAAEPGKSNHGNGIALDLNPGGSSKSRFSGVNEKVYEWLVKNSWRFGFVRTVATEEWHFDFKPDWAKSGPYGGVGKTGGIATGTKDTGAVGTKFYNKRKDGSYWGLDELKIT